MDEIITSPESHEWPPADDYQEALKAAFVFQVFFVVLACLMLDGGMFRRAFCAVSIGYWCGVVGVLVFRPGMWGLNYLRYGVVAGFGLVTILIVFCHDRVLDFVRG